MATLPDKFEAKRNEMFMVFPEVLTLVYDKKHILYDPRVEYNFEEGWVLAAMDGGIPDPIFVKQEDGNLLVIDGRQRVKAAIEANKRLKKAGKELLRVSVIPKRGDESYMLGLMISSNELRLENTIAIKAEMAQRYLNTGRTKREAAVRFGVSEQSVNNWLDYLDLSAPVRKAVDEGLMTASAAAALKELTVEEQKAKVDELKTSGIRVTGTVVKGAVATGKKQKFKRPSTLVVDKLLDQPEMPGEFRAFIDWLRGLASREETEEVLPWMIVVKEEPTGKRVKIAGTKRGKK